MIRRLAVCALAFSISTFSFAVAQQQTGGTPPDAAAQAPVVDPKAPVQTPVPPPPPPPKKEKKQKQKKVVVAPDPANAGKLFPVTVKVSVYNQQTGSGSVSSLRVDFAPMNASGTSAHGETNAQGEVRVELAEGSYNLTVDTNTTAIRQTVQVGPSSSGQVLVTIPSQGLSSGAPH